MIKFDIFLDIEDNRWTAAINDIAAVAEDVKSKVLQQVAEDIDFLNSDKTFYLNLCLSDDENVHKLNLEFRNQDKPTNVLSFANIDSEDFDDMLEFEQTIELGDIIIAYETMEREAKEQEVSFKNHFCHLWTHGILHILGYDHIKDNDREEMESHEIAILDKLGIENPYKE